MSWKSHSLHESFHTGITKFNTRCRYTMGYLKFNYKKIKSDPSKMISNCNFDVCNKNVMNLGLFVKPINNFTHKHTQNMILKIFIINPMFYPQCKWCMNDVWLLSVYRNFLFLPWPLFHLVFWFTLVVWSVPVQWNYWTVSTTLVSSTRGNTFPHTKYPNVFCPLSSRTVWVELHRPAISCECSVPLKWLSIILFGVAGV